MLIRPGVCTICLGPLAADTVQCPRCQCLVQLLPGAAVLSAPSEATAYITQMKQRAQVQIQVVPTDGWAHYVLGLCLVNQDSVKSFL
jgi:hypothetical protein